MNDHVHIMIVDDDPNLRRTLGDILELRGYEAFPFATGAEALKCVGTEEIMVALIDLRLEDISGLDVLRKIKETSPQTECILLTGHASQATAIEAVNLGAYSYFQKPYDMDQLLLSIHFAVEKYESANTLAESERRFRDMLSNVKLVAVMVDLKENITFCNDFLLELTGWKREEVIGKNWIEKFLPDHAKKQVTRVFEETVQEKNLSPHFENEIITRQGELRLIAWNNSVLRDKNGQVIGLASLGADITASKRAEDLLQRHVTELEVLYENSLTITRLLNPREIAQTITEILSQKMDWYHAAVFLYHPEREYLELLALHQPNAEPTLLSENFEHLQQAIQTPGQGMSGWTIKHGEAICSGNVKNDPRYVETFSDIRSGLYVPMKLGDTILGSFSVESTKPNAFDDQDQRLLSTMASQAAIAIHQAQLYEQVQQYAADLEKRVEERTADLQLANLELARSARMKDEFLASMSHELRTPLTGILGLSESLQMNTYGDLSDRHLKILKLIEESGRHLLELINDILDLSKIEAGKFDLQIEACSLGGICQASLQMARGMAQKKHLQTSFAIDPASIIVQADARRLKQMLVNLISNAVKFTPEGGSLGIEARGRMEDRQVQITIWDTGIGIKAEDLPKLFQVFVQLDSTLSRQYAGTGLGLALVQRMASMHGGSVEVESTPGQGSRFTIILPWEPEAQAVEKPETKKQNGLRSSMTFDEDDIHAELLTRYLQNLGIKNRNQPVALGAVEMAAEFAPDVILVHLNLPDKPGFQMLKEFKADPRTHNLPVLLMSVDDKRGEALAQGAAGFLLKPFTQADLQMELERILPRAHPLAPQIHNAPVVLMADDDKIILQGIADFLRSRNFQVVTVESGTELLERVESVRPNILLVDIQMPGITGFEVFKKIRGHPDVRISRIPMIALTALAMSGDRERCLAAGANEYMSKPVSFEKLVETIQTLCG